MPNAIITAAPMRPINFSPASRPPAIATPNSGDWVAIVLRFEDPDDNVNLNHHHGVLHDAVPIFDAAGFVFVAGLEGFLFLGGEVFAIVNAPRTEEHTV